MTSVDGKGLVQLPDIQECQVHRAFEDKIIEILSVLDSISDTISSVTEMYKQFCH